MFDDFYDAWHFLYDHKIYKERGLTANLCVDVVKVNPGTEEVDDNAEKNTAVRIWLESGPWLNNSDLEADMKKFFPEGIGQHDLDLDCGAATFEEAIIKLANLVFKKYGK